MRIAIIGGGIAGLSAAWQLRSGHPGEPPAQVSLFESSSRLGGTIDTVREGGFVVETGPDAWLTAKPWAAELARELGLENELIPSNDAMRKTWIYLDQRLLPIPDKMTLMVPADLDALTGSPLFSAKAVQAYREEPGRAAEFLRSIPLKDESVASFTLRHFGPEVLERIAAPLLSGVFGGDPHRLSARAALPALIAIERNYGSLIQGLRMERAGRPGPAPDTVSGRVQPALFTTMRSGLGTLVGRITAQIPSSWIHLNSPVHSIVRQERTQTNRPWVVTYSAGGHRAAESFDRVFLAVPTPAVRALIAPLDAAAAALLPDESSSAVLVAFAFSDALRVPVPPGFGILVAPEALASEASSYPSKSEEMPGSEPGQPRLMHPLLHACTFADQKFPYRVPTGGRLLRAYFSGAAAARLSTCKNDEIAAIGRLELARVLHAYSHRSAPLSGPTPEPLPEPLITVVRRLPDSLPQYTVGHLERAAEFSSRVATHLPGLTILGNSLHGLGIPDVIRDARRAAIDTTRRA
jgi:oxygen-dependent protoporphyrinogen oxidase